MGVPIATGCAVPKAVELPGDTAREPRSAVPRKIRKSCTRKFATAAAFCVPLHEPPRVR